jgi:hypothetical protein
MLQPVWAAALCLAMTACPARGTDSPAPVGATSPVYSTDERDSLHFDGSAFWLIDSEGSLHKLSVKDSPTVPYAVQLKTPLVVTALLAGLNPCSVVATGASAKSYGGYLPQWTGEGIAVLFRLPNALTGVSSAAVVLDSEGAEVWISATGKSGMFLEPATTAPEIDEHPAPIYTVTWQGGDAIFPFGDSPQLHRLGPLPTKGGWTSHDLHLAAKGRLADIELLAANPHGALLLLQYDFEVFEFITLDSEPLSISGRWMLEGQPLTRLIYPGPGDAYADLTLEGDVVQLAVVNKPAGQYENWQFDLAAATLFASRSAAPSTRAEDVSASTCEGSKFPQTILPAGTKPPWSCPAIYSSSGEEVLVVYGDGSAAWVKYE